MRLLGEPSARKVKSPNGEKLPRSKTGCLTCRRRRIKCGEEKPICHRCARRSLQCKYGQLASKPRDQFIFKDATPNPPVESFGSNSSETSMSASNFWDVPKAEHINAERRQAFFDFVDLGPFNADGTIHTFITKFWPVDPTSHNAVCIYEFSQTFGVSSTKSYKYCFRAVLMYISSLDKMLANMTLALALANANEYDLATTYYNEAVTSLEALIARIDEKSPSFDTVIALAAIWFMTQYEMFYHGDILLLQKHFDTFTDFIENNGNGSLPLSSLTDPPDSILADELIPGTVTTRLVVWTTYHDSMASSFGVGGRLSTLISSQVSINGLDLLRHRSQQSSQEMWQSYYPYEELFDDVVNQDIFQLHHHSLVIRFKTTQLQKKWLEGEFDDKLALNIMEHYESISQLFSEILSDSDDPAAEIHPKYSANVNTLRCCFLGPRLNFLAIAADAAEKRKTALASMGFDRIIQSVVKQILRYCCAIESTEYSSVIIRTVWSLFLCGLETDDPIYQSWIEHKFETLMAGKRGMEYSYKVLKEYHGKGVMAYVRSPHYGAFVV